MDDGLKQRLIGAFVLLALAVIFLPILFDRDRIEPVNKTTQIPIAPIIEPITIETPEPPVVEFEAKPADEMYIPDDTVVETLEPEASKFDAQGVPSSWVLQVASFSDAKRAAQLRDKLLEGGYAAFINTVQTDKGLMNRVYVGPKLEKVTLLNEKAAIEAKYKLSSILLKFKP